MATCQYSDAIGRRPLLCTPDGLFVIQPDGVDATLSCFDNPGFAANREYRAQEFLNIRCGVSRSAFAVNMLVFSAVAFEGGIQ